MAITTDTGAKKIAGSDNWRDIFDDHNETVDAYDANIASITDGLAIMANGNTHAAIAAGQAVYVRNHSTLAAGLYWANTAIATNATLSTSNLTADASGGLNHVLDTLNSNLKQRIQIGTTAYSGLGKNGWANRITVTVTLPYQMPNTNYFACAVLDGAYSDYPKIVCNVFNKAVSAFDVELIDMETGEGTVNGVIKWIAIAVI